MFKSFEFWFFFLWAITTACLLAVFCLRFWLVHVLTTKYPALYLHLGASAFCLASGANTRERPELISALRATPSEVLAKAERRAVNSIWFIQAFGYLGGMCATALIVLLPA